jgi:nucleotide-binding universal stress UspA family protein
MLKLRRVLVPVDFSAGSKAALEYAARLAERFGAVVEVLHVWEAPVYFGPGMGEAYIQAPNEAGVPLSAFVRDRAAKEMDELIAEIQGRSSAAMHGRIEMGDISDTIVSIARSDRHDLIVMGTHGRSGFSRVLMGSVAEKVVRRAPCPVLTVRSPANAQVKQAEPSDAAR